MEAWKIIEDQVQFVADGIEDAEWIELTIEIEGTGALRKRFYHQFVGQA